MQIWVTHSTVVPFWSASSERFSDMLNATLARASWVSICRVAMSVPSKEEASLTPPSATAVRVGIRRSRTRMIDVFRMRLRVHAPSSRMGVQDSTFQSSSPIQWIVEMAFPLVISIISSPSTRAIPDARGAPDSWSLIQTNPPRSTDGSAM